jgi:hypothetical protein
MTEGRAQGREGGRQGTVLAEEEGRMQPRGVD